MSLPLTVEGVSGAPLSVVPWRQCDTSLAVLCTCLRCARPCRGRGKVDTPLSRVWQKMKVRVDDPFEQGLAKDEGKGWCTSAKLFHVIRLYCRHMSVK